MGYSPPLREFRMSMIKRIVYVGTRQVNTPWRSPNAEVSLNITNQIHTNSTEAK
jgi:hypothetical protein